MRSDKRIIANIFFIMLGVALLGLGIAEIVDAFWSGMGSALIAVGVIRMVHFVRFRKDETYREQFKIDTTDERHRFIQNKAWAWTGYLFVLAAAVCSIVFKLLGQDLLSIAAGFSVCFMMVVYWLCYMFLNKKY